MHDFALGLVVGWTIYSWLLYGYLCRSAAAPDPNARRGLENDRGPARDSAEVIDDGFI